jgi:hypothetical protein
MRIIWQDFRYSARLLRKHPGFTLTAVAVLTLGIGVNAGIFGIINGLMIRPLAGADAPGEVVGVFSKNRTAARDYRPFSYPGFRDVRDAGGPFTYLAGHTVALAGVTQNNSTRQATVDIVTTGYFKTLGVQPVYGRDFTMDEERPGTAASFAKASRPPSSDSRSVWASPYCSAGDCVPRSIRSARSIR